MQPVSSEYATCVLHRTAMERKERAAQIVETSIPFEDNFPCRLFILRHRLRKRAPRPSTGCFKSSNDENSPASGALLYGEHPGLTSSSRALPHAGSLAAHPGRVSEEGTPAFHALSMQATSHFGHVEGAIAMTSEIFASRQNAWRALRRLCACVLVRFSPAQQVARPLSTPLGCFKDVTPNGIVVAMLNCSKADGEL